MSIEAEELRRELRELFERRARGDLRERDYQRQLVETSVALSRIVASSKLTKGERILAEHHLVHSHFKLTQSLLKEPEQATASFFASDRRMVRVCSTLLPGRPPSYDEADHTIVEDLAYEHVERIQRRRQVRWGEVATGFVVTLVALASGESLTVTGPLLVLLGIAGALHGLLVPTRSVEIVPRTSFEGPPFEIHGVHRRGARRILAIVEEAIDSRAARGQVNGTAAIGVGRANDDHGIDA
jgi:hypothetical protein